MNDPGLEAAKGLYFARTEKGVRISYFDSEDAGPAMVFEIDALVWSYIIAYVSKFGPLPVIIDAATALHEGLKDG